MSVPGRQALMISAAYVADRLASEPKDERTAADLGFKRGDRIEVAEITLDDGSRGFFAKLPNTDDQWMRI